MKSNELKDYWCSKMFLGNEDFKKLMGRALFLRHGVLKNCIRHKTMSQPS